MPLPIPPLTTKTQDLVRPAAADSVDYSAYAANPVGFITDVLGVSLTAEQIEIATSVRDKPETNIQASHGCGKTFLSACLILWHVLAVGGLAITTAPTKRQVTELLWGEVRRMHGRLGLPGECGKTFLQLTEDARAYGFTANDNNSNAFQGVHHPRLLVIEDEACGISVEIDEGASSCVTGSGNRFLRIGNPIEAGGPFEKACKRSHIRIPVWVHPNVSWAYEPDADGLHRLKPDVAAAVLDKDGQVKDPEQWPDWCPRDVIPGAVSLSWIEAARAQYGEDSVYWQTRVEGYFPEDAAQSVIPRAYFLAARRRYDENPTHWDAMAAPFVSRFGQDIGDGGDFHSLARWRGPVLYSIDKKATKGDLQDTSRAAGMAVLQLRQHGGFIHVDRGFGSGVIAMLKEQAFHAYGVHWGQAARDPRRFQNSKAEDFWTLREALRKGEVAIAPLGQWEEELMDDLSGIYYEETSTGKIKIEDKAKTRKRLHRSPDAGDGCVIGFRQEPRRPTPPPSVALRGW